MPEKPRSPGRRLTGLDGECFLRLEWYASGKIETPKPADRLSELSKRRKMMSMEVDIAGEISDLDDV